MHLSPEFGLTFQRIKDDGFKINKKVECLLSSDTPSAVAKSVGIACISFADAYMDLNPDLIILMGDRYEILAASQVALLMKIRIAHISGGDTTEGAYDEAIRHSITKMSHIHFVSNKLYKKRVVQLGEQPKTVFNFGTPGLDNIFNLKLLNKKDFEKSINFKLSKLNFLVTYHPVTLEENTSKKQFYEILKALDNYKNAKIIFTLPNSDTFGRVVIDLINKYVHVNKKNCISFKSLGQLRYLSALKHVSVVIGNSSSGIIEVPSFKIPTINIGDRQKGRLKSDSIIDCKPISSEIINAIDKSISEGFNNKLRTVKNIYGGGGASKKIKNKLKTISLNSIIKKKFYDL